jgi:hypothetical protein
VTLTELAERTGVHRMALGVPACELFDDAAVRGAAGHARLHGARRGRHGRSKQ